MKGKQLYLFSILLALLIGVVIGRIRFLQRSNLEIYQYDEPNRAASFEYLRTKDINLRNIPIDRLYDAKIKSEESKSSLRSSVNVTWTERGPNNFGGRTRALLFDPTDLNRKRVYAGSVSGGLWYNNDITDEGSKWFAVDDFLPSLAISTIAYNPKDSSNWYLGTGEGWYNADAVKGLGLFYSSNAGQTWLPIESTYNNPDFSYVQKIAVTETGVILAACRNEENRGGIYRSVDNGVSWENVIDGNPGADIEIANDVIYASTGIFNSGKLWKSTDDGKTWENITPKSNGQRIEIGVGNSRPDLVYAVASNNNDVIWMQKSMDGGLTWENVNIPSYLDASDCSSSKADFTRQQAWYDLIIAVNPNNPKIVVVGGVDLHRSMDGGESWEPISYWTSNCENYVHADQHAFIYRPGYSNQAICSNDGGVYLVQDISISKDLGGPVFERRNVGYNVTQFYSCAMENLTGSDVFLAGAQDNGSHLFSYSGNDETVEVTGGDGAFCFIDQDNSDIQISSYVGNLYFVTNDKWKSYDYFGNSKEGLFINPADYSSNKKVLFAAGNPDTLVRYSNINSLINVKEDKLKLSIGGSQISAITVSPYIDSVIYIGTTDAKLYKVFKPYNSNPIILSIRSSSFPAGYINNIALGESDLQMLAIFSNYGVKSVWETKDGGLSWESKEGNLPDIPVRWALYNPNNYNNVLLATELGVWETTNLDSSNPDWVQSIDGLSNVRCDMLKYRNSDGLVAVASHGRGLYTSNLFSEGSLAMFYIPNDVVYQNIPVSFRNTSTGASSYLWRFGDLGSSTEINPSFVFMNPGRYTVRLEINDDSGLFFEKEVVVLPKFSNSYTLADGGNFENNPDHFYALNRAGSKFTRGVSDVDGKSGANSGQFAWVIASKSNNYESNSVSYLFTPSFDFELSGTYLLEFYAKYDLEAEWDGFIIEYSKDAGKTWRKLGDYLDSESWYDYNAIDYAQIFPASKSFFSGNTNNKFVKKFTDVSFLSSERNVSFRFTFKSDQASEEAGLVIDDFQIIGPDSNLNRISFTADLDAACVNDFINIVNESSGNISSYSWDFGRGATPKTASGFGPFQVHYATSGFKEIVLQAEVDGSVKTVIKNLNISSLPNEPEIRIVDNEVCLGEPYVLKILNSESNVKYDIISINENIIVDEKYSLDTLTLMISGLEIGDNSLNIVASNSAGCSLTTDEIIVEVLQSPASSISISGNVLTCNFIGGTTYQWYLNDELIDGANTRRYTASENGSYTCLVTKNGCSQISESFDFAILSSDLVREVRFYPNPTNSELNIDLTEKTSGIVTIYDVAGNLITSNTFFNESALRLDISNSEIGMKIIEVRIGEFVKKFKVLKQ